MPTRSQSESRVVPRRDYCIEVILTLSVRIWKHLDLLPISNSDSAYPHLIMIRG
jgi:signal recognition particle subunit SEC65